MKMNRINKKRRRGYSLIDVLIGMALLAWALGSAFALAAHNARTMERNQSLAGASLLAQSKMEELRNLTYANIASGSDVGTINAQGDPDGIYSRSWDVATDSPALGLKTVTVNVQWERWGKTEIYTLHGVVAQ